METNLSLRPINTPAPSVLPPPELTAQPAVSKLPAQSPEAGEQSLFNASGFEASAAQSPVVLQVAANAAPSFGSNAILNRYTPTGASATTASQDGLPGGVTSSYLMADADRARVLKYKPQLEAAAAKYGVPPALLAAIASRESRGGAALDSNGTGDGGWGFGLMQVDKGYHTPVGGPFSQAHIDQATSILKRYLDDMRSRFPSWPPEQQLRGAVVAYNSGPDNVRTIGGMDIGTTGNDYSNDVWARALRLANDFPGTGATPSPSPTPAPGGSADLSRIPPGTVLGLGDQSQSVSILQNALNKLGYGLQADGVFGGQTEAAIMDFQRRNGLTADGVAGPQTLQALSRALQPAPSPAPGVWTPAPSLDQVRTVPETFLKEGMEGDAVRQLQQMLGMPAAQQNGKFDAATKQAVTAFQAANGLTPPAGKEGWVGKTTLEFIEKASGPAPAPAPGAWTPAPSLAEVRSGTAMLKEGMQGEAVKYVQKLLGLEQDGQYGPATKKAVNDFQWDKGLKPPPGLEGVVGKTTLEELEKASQGGGVDGISAKGREQMRKLLDHALANNTGVSGGRCFEYVWKYMTTVGYGKLDDYNDAPDMPSTYARNFAEYMNQGDNAARWGLKKLNVSHPHDAPAGAIVVVGPRSPGTAHPTAGDIAISRGDGYYFVNDGPRMNYGSREDFFRNGGTLLGVYVPM